MSLKNEGLTGRSHAFGATLIQWLLLCTACTTTPYPQLEKRVGCEPVAMLCSERVSAPTAALLIPSRARQRFFRVARAALLCRDQRGEFLDVPSLPGWEKQAPNEREPITQINGDCDIVDCSQVTEACERPDRPVAVPSRCRRAPLDGGRDCLRIEKEGFPPRYIGAGNVFPADASVGSGCEEVECGVFGGGTDDEL